MNRTMLTSTIGILKEPIVARFGLVPDSGSCGSRGSTTRSVLGVAQGSRSLQRLNRNCRQAICKSPRCGFACRVAVKFFASGNAAYGAMRFQCYSSRHAPAELLPMPSDPRYAASNAPLMQDDGAEGRARAPRMFLVLLGAYFVQEVIGSLLAPYKLVRTAILGLAAWKALKGSQAAARFLGALIVLEALLAAWTMVRLFPLVNSGAVSALSGLVVPVLAIALLFSLASYLFFSPKLQAVFAEGARKRWSGH